MHPDLKRTVRCNVCHGQANAGNLLTFETRLGRDIGDRARHILRRLETHAGQFGLIEVDHHRGRVQPGRTELLERHRRAPAFVDQSFTDDADPGIS